MPINPQRPSILIVDDEYRLGRFVALALEKLGYTTHTCISASEARTLMASGSWHLVVSDIFMPTESGLDLARWIGDWYPEVPTVLMTAHSSDAVKASAHQLGVAALLHKPFTVEQLRHTVREILQQVQTMPSWRADAVAKYH